jgi:hypothetical protein
LEGVEEERGLGQEEYSGRVVSYGNPEAWSELKRRGDSDRKSTLEESSLT